MHTGQYFDANMSDIFFDKLEIARPRYQLEVHSLSHGAMTGRMLERIEQVLIAERPAMVLVYGDTNSTASGALAAAKLAIPVAHVEAGLQSFNRRMSEEHNRILADHLSTLLLCPTRVAITNLGRECIKSGVHAVGDVMYDAALAAAERAKINSRIRNVLGLEPRSYFVATIHRAENSDNLSRFRAIMAWLEREARKALIVMPLHPRTRNLIRAHDLAPQGVRLIDPVGYIDMTSLVSNSLGVFTDSGGLQKEAYFHRVRCVTLRDETEWVETIDAGWNRLWTSEDYAGAPSEIPDFGAGDTAVRIAAIIAAEIRSMS